MNTVLLNTVNLDDGRIIKKGGSGGGVTIKNQTKSVTIAENGNTVVSYDSGYTGLEKVSVKVAIPNEEKTVDITENGTTEVVADNGFLSKVVVNTNVASGGGGGSDMPVIGDGKTYLYIKIAERKEVTLNFSQTVSKGVTIDWGDGSPTQTSIYTDVYSAHTYADKGEYVISLNPADGCTLDLGVKSSSYYVLGKTEDYNNTGYMLQAVEIGKGVKEIATYAFQECWALSNVIIPMGVTRIGSYAFSMCISLTNLSLPDSITRIDSYAFRRCYALKNIIIPDSIAQIDSYAFEDCYNLISAKLPLTTTIINDSTFNSCYNLKNIDIPDNVTNVGSSAFYKCYSLEKLVFKTTLQYLRSNAFGLCKGMRCIDFSNSTYVINLENKNSFSSIASDCRIVVPDSLYDAWIAATNWSISTIANKIIKKSAWDAQNT